MSNPSDFVIENGVLKEYVGTEKDIVIPDGVETIGWWAFDNCKGMASVTIPASVTHINCYYIPDTLNAVYIHDLAAWCRIRFGEDYRDPANPLKKAHDLYLDGQKVTEIVLPEGITSISDSFYGCSLTSVVISSSVMWLGAGAFCDCTHLRKVTIQEGVKNITNAFCGCTSLTSMVIPKSVEHIYGEPFRGCTNLKTLFFQCKERAISADILKGSSERLGVVDASKRLAFWQERGLGIHAARGFIYCFQDYSDQEIIDEFVSYISSQRKKLLPIVYEEDRVEILWLLAEKKKITKKNVEQDYLLPAMQCKAEKCVAFLESLFSETKTKPKQSPREKNELTDKINGAQL